VDSFHRELGKLMWEYCGMSRNRGRLKLALSKIPGLREQYWREVKVLGSGEELNQSLEKAGRVADFFELAELICLDALERNESCGAISARNTRRRKAKPRAMTHTILTPRHGNSAGGQPADLHRSRSPSNTYTRRRGATSNEIILHIWRQRNADDKGRMARYEVPNVNEHMSFLEMLDVLNEDLIAKDEEPVRSTTIAARASAACAARW